MARFIPITVSLLVVASIAATVAIESAAGGRQRAQSQLLDEQSAQIERLRPENNRLSNHTVQTAPSPALSSQELTELLQLRNEATQLRKLAAEKPRLEATNAALRDFAAASREQLAQARALPGYVPLNQLAYAGYANPQSTLKSLLAAMKNGDLDAFTNCFAPKAAAEMAADMNQPGLDATQHQAEIKTGFTDFLGQAEGFHVSDQTIMDSNNITLKFTLDGGATGPAGGRRTTELKLSKFGDGWKISGGGL